MKRLTSVALFLILSFLFSTHLHAVEVSVFGTEQYNRSKGAPNEYTDSFPALAGEAVIEIKNGDDAGKNRVSSARIHINGQQVFGPSDFNQKVSSLTKTIDLVAQNFISVELQSKPGSYLSVKIMQDAEAPTVSILADPETILLGETATITWSSNNADTLSIEPDVGNTDLSGSIEISPTETTTYTATAKGLGGTESASVTVTVLSAPSVAITANPATISLGESALLTWESENAETILIEPDIGDVTGLDSYEVTPSETTTYTITATGPGGTATDTATIEVEDSNTPPIIDFRAEPAIIDQGGSASLIWSSVNGESAFIDNGIGSVPISDSKTVSPNHTTTYTLTVTGPNGSTSEQVVVMVHGNPEPPSENSFGDQYTDLIPWDATVEAYDVKRFSLITGQVFNTDKSPIPGVSVSVREHGEYGTSITDLNGRFSLPVEGGKTMTLVYREDGYLTSHRKISVGWNKVAIAETIYMTSADPVSTTLAFDGNPETVVTHRSTEVTDESGSRACTMVFEGDNKAYLMDESGNTVHELTSITTRATEFKTPESMPAKLPPNSGFTYCVDLSVDGVQRVNFKDPVIIWVDNFIGFSVGEVAPVGYYDKDRGVWVPSRDGWVVRLLDTDADGVVDALDKDGDNEPDDMNDDGSFRDEVTGLENPQEYSPGSTFWRVEVTHFTPFDINWPVRAPVDAKPPNPDGIPTADIKKDNGRDCQNYTSSFVEERGRIFHEDIPIPGTDITLHYISNSVDGYLYKISVPASGNYVPSSLQGITVEVKLAGKRMAQTIMKSQSNDLTNQMFEFNWDGYDYLGNKVIYQTTAEVKIGFIYHGEFFSAAIFSPAFGQAGSNGTGITTRQPVILWRSNDVNIKPKREGVLAEGWTLSNHHYFSPSDPFILQKGDGTEIENNTTIIDTIAGDGNRGYSGDGGPATAASLNQPYSVAVDAIGNIYVADMGNDIIRKIDTNGTITTVAGNGDQYGGGDGFPAIESALSWMTDVEVDNSGNIYFVEPATTRVFKVDINGILHHIAGAGTGYSGDGGPAKQAKMYRPSGIGLDNLGNLYIADTANHVVRKVDPNGTITTIAGTGNRGTWGSGVPATGAELYSPKDVAIDADGNIYIPTYHCIRKVDTGGIITRFAGYCGRYGYNGDGRLATSTYLNGPNGLVFDDLGNLYFSDIGNNRVRKIDTNGIVSTVAGYGTRGFSGDGDLAIRAQFEGTIGLDVDAAGNVFIPDVNNHRIRKIGLPASLSNQTVLGDVVFAEEEGFGYIMTGTGRHKKTIDLHIGLTLFDFEYDENNNVISIVDHLNNQITIERDGNGEATAIISPDGITTSLTIDADNHLNRITYPDSTYYDFEYSPGGLLTAKTEPEGNRFEHVFDDIGRLTDAKDDEGGHWNYSSTTDIKGDTMTSVQTGEGNITTYLDHTTSDGAYTSAITDPTGGETLFTQTADGLTVNKSLSCGMEFEFNYDADPEYKFIFLNETIERTPSSLQRVITRDKTYQDTDADEIPDLITETISLNDQTTTLEHNILESKKTITSPESRSQTTFYDQTTLLATSLTIPDLHDIVYDYDNRGRLTSILSNTRETSISYNSVGFISSITDSEKQSTIFEYDTFGRITRINRPDDTGVRLTYDGNGNMTMLTTPSTIDHQFFYNGVNLKNFYETPISGSYEYVYDTDRRLAQIIFPSGNNIYNVYENTRLKQIQTPEGNIDFTYLCGSKVDSVTVGSETIRYNYDGKLVTSEYFSGTLDQTISYSYNNEFNVSEHTYSGATNNYTYDNDGLLTGAGDFTIIRDSGNGLPESVTDGILSLNRVFNGYAELIEESYSVESSNISSWTAGRDKNGRILSKSESVSGISESFAYTYDPMGRLLTVTKDGGLIEEYQYGLNGVRVYEMNSLRGITGRTFEYSDEDHLLTAGNTTYQYDLDGFLTTKTEGSAITNYVYSSRGELMSVTLPDGTSVEYIHDPLGRRIAKKIDGSIVEKYLWQGITRLLTVYDGNDNLLMRFEYADGRMPYAVKMGGSNYYLGYDQVGSLRVVSDASSNIVNAIEYDSFGNLIAETNPSFKVPFGFAGGLHDRDTGLVRFGHRDYDPDIGRWTAKDPIFFEGGDTDLYGYVLNDPVNVVDPPGLWGFFGGWTFRVNAPAASIEGGGRLVIGTENGGSRVTIAGGGGGTILAGGASAGRGTEGGFFLGDVSDFFNYNSINIDSPIGGLSILLDSEGNFKGIGVGGPSVGFGVSFTGPDSPTFSTGGKTDLINMTPNSNPCK